MTAGHGTDGPNRSETSGRDRGAVIPIVVISLAVLLIMTAFSVDLGRLMLRRREMQSVSDVAALDLSRLVNGRTAKQIAQDPTWASVFNDTRAQNNFSAQGARTFVVDLGTYISSTKTFTTICSFTAGTTPCTSDQVPDAVRVTSGDHVDFFFAGSGSNTSRAAVAQQLGWAKYSVGSFALGLNSSNSLMLNTLLADALNTTVLGYNGLATSSITLGDLATQLGFGTPNELVNSSVSARNFMLAAATLLQNKGDTANATILNNAAAQVNSSTTVDFADIVAASAPGNGSAVDTSINVLDLLSAVAFVANGTAALGLPAINLGVGSLANATSSISVVEPPAICEGHVSSQPPCQTKQLTLNLTTSGNVALGALLPVAVVDVTLSLSAAQADTLITAITCGVGTNKLSVQVLNSLFQQNLVIGVKLPLLPRVPLTVSQGPTTSTDTATWTIPPDVLGQTVKQTGAGSVGLTGLAVSGGGGLGSMLGTVMSVVVNPIIAALDSKVLGPLTDLFGINVAGADLVALDIDCDGIQLVQ